MSDPTKTKTQVNEQESSEQELSFSDNLGVLSELGGSKISPYQGPAAAYRFPFPQSMPPPPFALTATPADHKNPRSGNFTILCHEPTPENHEKMGGFEPKQDKKAMHGGTRHTTRNAGRPGSVLTHAIHRPHNPDEKVPEGWFPSTDGNIYQYPPGAESEHQRGRYRYQVRAALANEFNQGLYDHRTSNATVQMSKDGPEAPAQEGTQQPPMQVSYLATAVTRPMKGVWEETPIGWFSAPDGNFYQYPPELSTHGMRSLYAQRIYSELRMKEATPSTHAGSQGPWSGAYRLTVSDNGTGHLHIEAPAGATEQEILRHALIKVLDISTEEANDAIRTDRLSIPGYSGNGDPSGIEGVVWHHLIIPPRLMERTKGQPGTQNQRNRQEPLLVAYSHLHRWLGNQPAPEAGATAQQQVASWMAATSQDPEVQAALRALTQYLATHAGGVQPSHMAITGELAEMLTWDRMALARTTMAAEDREEERRRELANDTGTSIIDELRRIELEAVAATPQAIRERFSQHPNADLFAYYEDLRRDLFAVEGRMEGQHPGDHLGPALSARIQDFSQRVQVAAANHGSHGKRPGEQYHTVSYHKFHTGIIATLIAKAGARSPEENRQLLTETYRACFTMFELLGYNTATTAEGNQLEAMGRKGTRVMDIVADHPEAQPISARFIPQADLDALPLGTPPAQAPGYALRMFTWYDRTTAEWVLADYTGHQQAQAGKVMHNRAKGHPDGPLPAELFAMLDSSLRFPKGAIIYRAPGEGTHRIQRTHADTTPESFFQGVGFALLAAAAFIPSAGASAMVITGLVITSIAQVSELHRKETLGVATKKDYLIAAADLVGSLSGAGMAAIKVAGKAGAGIYRVLQVAEVAGDTVAFAFYAREAYESVTQYAQLNPADAAGLTRLILFNIAMGTMQGIGIRGSVKDLKAGKGSDAAPGLDPAATKGQGFEPNKHKPSKVELQEEKIKLLKAEVGSLKKRIKVLEAELGHQREFSDMELAAIQKGLVTLDITTLIGGLGYEVYQRSLGLAYRKLRQWYFDPSAFKELTLDQLELKFRQVEITYEQFALEFRKIVPELAKLPGVEQLIDIFYRDIKLQGVETEQTKYALRYHSQNPENLHNNVDVREGYANFKDPSAKRPEGEFKAGNKKEGWNEVLNQPLLPNFTYHISGYTFKTDHEGRVNEVQGQMRLQKNDRNSHQQGISVTKKDGRRGKDDGGHIIACIFDGPGEQINYWPQIAGEVNRGSWKQMENLCARSLKEGKEVSVVLKAEFEPGNKRPISFIADVFINGDLKRFEIKN